MLVLWLASGLLSGAPEAPLPVSVPVGRGSSSGHVSPARQRRIVQIVRLAEDATQEASQGRFEDAARIAAMAAQQAREEAKREADADATALEEIADRILAAGERAAQARASEGLERLGALLEYRTALTAIYVIQAALMQDEEDAALALLFAS